MEMDCYSDPLSKASVLLIVLYCLFYSLFMDTRKKSKFIATKQESKSLPSSFVDTEKGMWNLLMCLNSGGFS